MNDTPTGSPFDHLITFPVRGTVYTIRGIQNKSGTVVLEEIRNRPLVFKICVLEPHFRATRFKPFRETNIDCFRAMLEPSGIQTLESAKEDA